MQGFPRLPQPNHPCNKCLFSLQFFSLCCAQFIYFPSVCIFGGIQPVDWTHSVRAIHRDNPSPLQAAQVTGQEQIIECGMYS